MLTSDEIIDTIKERSAVEKIIGILGFIVGGCLIFHSVFFIWAYNIQGGLWLFMLSMTQLVSELLIGASLITSSLLLFKKGNLAFAFYRLAAIIIILVPLNEEIALIINIYSFEGVFDLRYFTITIRDAFVFTIGISLFLFFNRYRTNLTNRYLSNKCLIPIALLLFIFIDCIFTFWYY